MAYNAKVWVDRQTEYPTRRKLTFDDGITPDKIVTVSREEGTIYEPGDVFDANTMNNFEARINAGLQEKQNNLTPGNGIRIDQDNVISATGGGGGIEFTKIESGAMVSVNDAADLPVVDIAVGIVAQQSGSGDPSPSNVRPISGFTGLNLTRAGANIWNEDWEQGSIDNNGADESSTTRIRSKGYISVKGNTSYFFAWISPETTAFRLYYYDASQTFISYQQIDITTTYPNGRSFTTPVNCAYIRFRTAGTGSITTYSNNISINYPSTDTTYHAYSGAVLHITWQTEAGTVYGGTLDVTTGLLTVTHGYVVFDGSQADSDFAYSSTSSRITWIPYANIGKVDSVDFKSNMLRVVPKGTTPAEWGVTTSANSARCFIGVPSSIASVADWQTYVTSNNIQLVYELATPQTVQLTPQQVETIRGINNIYADTGDILNLEYYTTSAADVRDFMLKDNVTDDDSTWSSDKISTELAAKQAALTPGDNITIDLNNEISARVWKDLTGRLEIGFTSLTISDESITTNSTIEVFTDVYGINPNSISVSTGSITLSFTAQEFTLNVKVRVS